MWKCHIDDGAIFSRRLVFVSVLLSVEEGRRFFVVISNKSG